MTFSQAIEKAKSGSQITRASWRDQYVALTTGICYRSYGIRPALVLPSDFRI